MFAKHPAGQEYRWYEVAFYSLEQEPEYWYTHAVTPLDDKFDIALTGKLYVIQVAFGPVACDGENERAARNRWLALLGQAATSKLFHNRPPIPLTETYFEELQSS